MKNLPQYDRKVNSPARKTQRRFSYWTIRNAALLILTLRRIQKRTGLRVQASLRALAKDLGIAVQELRSAIACAEYHGRLRVSRPRGYQRFGLVFDAENTGRLRHQRLHPLAPNQLLTYWNNTPQHKTIEVTQEIKPNQHTIPESDLRSYSSDNINSYGRDERVVATAPTRRDLTTVRKHSAADIAKALAYADKWQERQIFEGNRRHDDSALGLERHAFAAACLNIATACNQTDPEFGARCWAMVQADPYWRPRILTPWYFVQRARTIVSQWESWGRTFPPPVCVPSLDRPSCLPEWTNAEPYAFTPNFAEIRKACGFAAAAPEHAAVARQEKRHARNVPNTPTVGNGLILIFNQDKVMRSENASIVSAERCERAEHASHEMPHGGLHTRGCRSLRTVIERIGARVKNGSGGAW
jgi:hypothetical protein